MKKLLTLFLLTFLLFQTNITSAEKSYTCKNLDINISLLPNGNAVIMEKWTFTYKGDSFSCFMRHIPIDDSAPIANITVFEKDTPYTKLPALTKKDPPNHYAVGKNSKEYIIETYFYAKNQTRTFTLVYTMSNAVIMHNDIAEFYNKLISDFDVPIQNLSAVITMPEGASNEDIRIWAHGPLNGTIEKSADNKILVNVTNVPRKTFVEVRATMPTSLFPAATSFTHKDASTDILAQETKWADEANEQRELLAKKEEIGNIASAIILALYSIAFFIYIYLIYKTVRKRRQFIPKNKPKYYRELPSDLTPAEVNSLVYYIKTLGRKNINLAHSATLLNLYLKEYIDIKETVKKGFFSDSQEVSISVNRDKNTDDLKKPEKAFLGLLKSATYRHESQTLDQIKSYFQTNRYVVQKTLEDFDKQINDELVKNDYLKKSGKNLFYFLNFFLVLIFIASLLVSIFFSTSYLFIIMSVISIYPIVLCVSTSIFFHKKYLPTEKGTAEIVLWQAFKKFLQDFTLFDEKDLPDLTVWESYLVYAVALGEGDKLFKKLKLKYPELQNSSGIYASSRFSRMHVISNNPNLFNSFGSVASSMRNPSSGSGGGGGFSGGGGGGRGGGGGGCR